MHVISKRITLPAILLGSSTVIHAPFNFNIEGRPPELDWATADYRFTDWFGVRAGKVKTVFGLHNDTLDMEFLHTAGSLAYTAFVGDRRENLEGGYAYLLKDRKIFMNGYGGLQDGADLRWNTSVPGLLAGVARMTGR